MSYVFLKGSETNQENQSCILVPMSQGGNKMSYEGPENPAVAIELLSTNLCITPAKTIPEDVTVDNGNAGFEGKCVIEVDGRIVPHVFKVEDLPFYFNEQNTNGYGISFEQVTISYTRISTGKKETRNVTGAITPQSIDPEFNWSGTLTPEQEADLADRKDLVFDDGVDSIVGNFGTWTNVDTVTINSGDVGNGVFAGMSIGKVTIGNKTRVVGGSAFAANRHENPILILGEGIEEIQRAAFVAWGGGTKIKLPMSLRALRDSVFASWTKLVELDLGGLEVLGSLTETIRPFAGSGAEGLVVKMGPNLHTVGTESLGWFTKAKQLTLSPVLKHVGKRGLMDFGFDVKGNSDFPPISLTFPDTMENIDQSAFMRANIGTIEFGESPELTIRDMAFASTSVTSVVVKKAKLFEGYCFMSNQHLVHLDLGEGVHTLNGCVFQECPLVNVHIPSGVKVASGGVFNDISTIETFTIDEGLLQLGTPTSNTGFFSGTPSPIKELIFPNSLEKVYGESLAPLGQLKRVYWGPNITLLDNVMYNGGGIRDVFMMMPYAVGVKIPSDLTPMFCLHLNDLNLASGVTNKSYIAYTSIPVTASFPDEAPLQPLENSIANWSFQFRDLDSGKVMQRAVGETIPENWQGKDLLPNIDEVLINSTVKTISPEAFEIQSIKRIRAMEGVENVGSFMGHIRLRECILPSTVKRLGNPIFRDVSLQRVEMPTEGYLAVDATQFDGWSDDMEHPTVSVDVPTVTNIVQTDVSISGNVQQPNLIVTLLTKGGEAGETITDVTGNFTINVSEGAFVIGEEAAFRVSDVVDNSTITTFIPT